MISFFFDGTAFTGATVTVDSTAGSQVFTYPGDASLVPSLDRSSAYAIAESFRLWLINPARIWEGDWPGGSPRATLTATESSDNKIAFSIDLISGHPFMTYTWVVSASMGSVMGWVDWELDGINYVWRNTAGAIGTCYNDLFKVENWSRWSVEQGVSASGGSYSTAAPSSALRRPEVSGLYTAARMLRLTTAITEHNSPRKAYAYQSDFDVWREIAVAEIASEKVDPLFYDVNFKAVG